MFKPKKRGHPRVPGIYTYDPTLALLKLHCSKFYTHGFVLFWLLLSTFAAIGGGLCPGKCRVCDHDSPCHLGSFSIRLWGIKAVLKPIPTLTWKFAPLAIYHCKFQNRKTTTYLPRFSMNIISCDQFFSQIAILDCQIGSTMFLPLLDNQLRFSLEQCAIQTSLAFGCCVCLEFAQKRWIPILVLGVSLQ